MVNSKVGQKVEELKKAVSRDRGRKPTPKVSEKSIEKILRLSLGLGRYKEYFSSKTTSLTADKLQGFLKFLAVEAPGAKIGRLTLYSFNRFFRPDGEVRIAIELERIRQLMLKRARAIHAVYDDMARRKLSQLQDELISADTRMERKLQRKIDQLKDFLQLPGGLEIRSLAIEEISSRLKARNIKTNRELNLPPEGGIFRIALRDCTIEGFKTQNGMHVNIVPFHPAHLLTYAINAGLLNDKTADQARQWWEYTVRTMGAEGAQKFYGMIGYLMVTKYPLPTERTVIIIVGDPGSGKGTHLAAVEQLLTFDELTLFAKAGPHKFTDPREHFSSQNLQNKLALISGDLKHDRIHDFSAVNDLFGGESQEMEKKFKDPTTEKPTFKAFWATTPPLFKIDQAGGAWRRVLMVLTNPVSDSNRDDELKSKMLGMLDGFFLNGLIGLSYLVANGWEFTDKLSDAEIEDLWTFYSDSVRVWAQNLDPEPEVIEVNEVRTSTLYDTHTEITSAENLASRVVVDDLYAQYAAWCVKKQIEPVKPKTFSAWLSSNGYTLRKRTIEDGVFKGKRKIVTYVTWNSNDDSDRDLDWTEGYFTWGAYVSRAPLTIGSVSDPSGHFSRKECFHEKFSDHVIRLLSRIGHNGNQSP